MSFTKALNGLNAAAKNLEVIGNNVANANTVGFKAGQMYFSEVMANSQSAGGSDVGAAGAATIKVMPQFSQGNFNVTNNPLDLGVNGQGMFVLKDQDSTIYSRAGQFTLDSEGYVINPAGARVQGFLPNDTGVATAGNMVDLKVDTTEVPPVASTSASVTLNLDSRKTALTSAGFRLNDSASYHNATSLTAYDDLGVAHTLSTYYVKTGDNQWDVFAAADGKQVGTGPAGTLKFLANGELDTAATTLPLTLDLEVAGGAKSPLSMTLDLGKATQTGRSFSVSDVTADGSAAGQISSYSVGADGVITGRFSNGTSKPLGQVALALFNNLQGLRALGTNGFASTAESGEPKIGVANSGMFGSMQSGQLEQSNVDLTNELVRMIEAQRVYQANAQAIKAQDEILRTASNFG
jgi:flagellar hook protein FlgE